MRPQSARYAIDQLRSLGLQRVRVDDDGSFGNIEPSTNVAVGEDVVYAGRDPEVEVLGVGERAVNLDLADRITCVRIQARRELKRSA